MNPDELLKPINRRTYVIGVVTIGVASMVIGLMYAVEPTLSSSVSGVLPSAMLLCLVKIVWDYKRIRDITLNTSYLWLLLIPFMGGTIALIKIETALSGSLSFTTSKIITLILVFFSVVNFFYLIYLIMKRGPRSKRLRFKKIRLGRNKKTKVPV